MLNYQSRRIVALISLIVFSVQPLIQAYSTSYGDQITDQYLSSYGQAPKIKPTNTQANEKTFKQRFLDFVRGPEFKPQNVTRTPRELNDLLMKVSPLKTQPHAEITDPQSIKKLEVLLGGEQSAQTLLKHVSTDQHGTELINTLNGKKCFAEMLAQPIHEQNVLKGRQTIINAFLGNESLIKKTNSITTQMKKCQNTFLEFFAEKDPAQEKFIESVYFGSYVNALNKNTSILEASNRLGTLFTTIFASNIIKGLYFSSVSLRLNRQNPLATQGIKNASPYIVPESIGASLLRSIPDTALRIADLPSKFKTNLPLVVTNPNLETKEKVIIFSVLGAIAALETFSIYSAYKNISFNNAVIRTLQEKMIGVASYVDGMKKLYILAKRTPKIAQNMPELKALECLVKRSNNHSAEFNKLIDLLETNTFKGDPSIFSLNGRILAAYKLMQEVKEEFAELLHAAGQLEAYWAVARKIETSTPTDHPYCFAQFVESNMPYFYAHEFCNPFVSAQNIVPNSIEMKADASGHIILTGPNTGGKSTLIKSLWINILLAQTFGIAYAKEFVITPFHKLGSYLNINDNISEGISLFKAEVNRASELRDMVKDLAPHEFMFLIMDEMFSGTNPESAQTISYDFITQMAQFKNCLFIDATHFPKLNELEEEGICKNYQMEILVDENNPSKTTCTYKLLEGASKISNAQNIVKNEGLITW